MLFKFILLCLLMVPAICSASGNASEKAAQLNQLTQQINQLQAVIAQDKNQQAQLNYSLQNSTSTFWKLQQKIKTLNQALSDRETNLSVLQRNQQTQQQQLVQQYSLLNAQLRYAFFLNAQQKVLNADNQRLLTYMDYIGQERLGVINQLSNSVSQLQTQQSQMVTQQSALQTKLAQQQKSKQLLTLAQKNQKHVLSQVNSRLQQRSQQLSELMANKQALQQLLTQLETTKKIAKENKLPAWIPPPGMPFGKLVGRLPWPTQGQIEEHFGVPVDGSELRYTGVLIAATHDDPVRVIDQGQIIFAGVLRGLGLLIIVDHGGGYISLYGHNQQLYKKVGDVVKSGDVIASVGNSGAVGQYGLYFEIRHNSTPLNPEQWCRTA